jgi:hypothetical protein
VRSVGSRFWLFSWICTGLIAIYGGNWTSSARGARIPIPTFLCGFQTSCIGVWEAWRIVVSVESLFICVYWRKKQQQYFGHFIDISMQSDPGACKKLCKLFDAFCGVSNGVVDWLKQESGRWRQFSNLHSRNADIVRFCGYSGLWRLDSREVMCGGIGNDGKVCASMPSIGVFLISKCKALQNSWRVDLGDSLEGLSKLINRASARLQL